MSPFRFHRVGLLTPDLEHAAATYLAIGCEQHNHPGTTPHDKATLLGAGTDVLLEVQAPPFSPRAQQYIDQQKHSIDRVTLACTDVGTAHGELVANGVASAWEPDAEGTAGVLSPEGLLIELVQAADPAALPRTDRGQLALHHACYLTPDLAAAESFWVQHFGLTKTYDFTAPLDSGGTKGFVMLSDPHYDEAGHDFSLEIIGGEFDSIDGPVFERRGACFDHVCFTTDDVAGVWQRAVDLGVEPLCEPAHYAEYDSTIAWLYDADGTHVELMSPVPDNMMGDHHRTGVCSNDWVDDWQREPVVLPRKGNQPVTVAP